MLEFGFYPLYGINMYLGKYAIIWVFLLQVQYCDKISSKYQFLQFENFQNTIKTYINERVLVSKLQELKHFLKKTKTFLGDNSVEFQSNPMNSNFSVIMHYISIAKMSYLNGFAEMSSLQSHLPSNEDFIGSQKGLLTLHNAYEFNITELILHQNLTWYKNGLTIPMSTYEKLDVFDVEQLINLAISYEDYALAIKIMKPLLQLRG